MNANLQSKSKIYIIVGPTSSGKTSLAIKLCLQLNGEIISADSRQVVKQMDIGTGKIPVNQPQTQVTKTPDHYEINHIPVWGYDLINPDQEFSSYDFAVYAKEKIADIVGRGKTPFVVGGTGFYVDMLMGRTQPSPIDSDPTLRAKLTAMSADELLDKLVELNPKRAETIDIQNKMRLIRAVEIELLRPTTIPQTKPLEPLDLNKYQPVYIGLNTDRDILYIRVDLWLDTIWDNGLIDETRHLLSLYPENLKLKGIVYSQACDLINGSATLEEAKQLAKNALHAYIRRQITWFKRNHAIKWFDISSQTLALDVLNFITQQKLV